MKSVGGRGGWPEKDIRKLLEVLFFSDFGAGGDARVHFLLLHGYLCVGRTRHEKNLTRGRKRLRELI